MKNNTKNLYNLSVSLVLIIFCGTFFILNLFSKDKSFSDAENRTLAVFPKFTIEKLFSGKWTQEYETYITDQFFGRDTWVGLKYYTERALLKTENNGVYFGKDDYLLKKFPPVDEAKLAGNFKNVENLIGSLDVPVHFSLVPSSTHTLRDKLPPFAQEYDQGKILDKAQALFPENYFDIGEKMWENRDEYIYYRTDHHWTSDGAYLAYEAFCQKNGKPIVPKTDIELTYPDFYGTTYSTAGVRGIEGDVVTAYQLPNVTVTDYEGKEISFYDQSFGEKKDKYSVFLGGNHPLLTIENHDNVSGDNLLIIKDSYSNALLPFLIQNYSKITVLDLRFNKSSIKDYVSTTKSDEVLVLYSTENFCTDVNMFVMGK